MQLVVQARKTVSVRYLVYQALRHDIMTLQLEPGQSITKGELAEKLRVSRTPVGEAFIQLANEDLVEIYPQKGTIVSLIDSRHMHEAKFVRDSLEGAVIRLACQNFAANWLFELESNLNAMAFQMKQTNNTATLFSLDEDFHQIIFKGCRNERSWSLISQMSTHLNRMRFLKMKSAISTWEKVLHEHGEIYRAIETGDVVRGQAGIAQNLDSDDIMFQRIIQQFASYFK